MREFANVNVELFREAIEEYNAWPARTELGLVFFDLGPELKESTLTLFMEQIESIPPEKEDIIPPKTTEIYNHLFDPDYVMTAEAFNKKEEVKMEEPKTETAVEAKPVKEKKEKKPKAPRGPKGKSDKTAFMESLILQATYTRKQIIEKCVEKFACSIGSVMTALTDGKNPKYNRFSQLVIEDKETHILHF